MVKIVEAYKDWLPPPKTRAAVEALIASVPDRYAIGLGCIVLSNSSALTGHRKRRKHKSSGGKYPSSDVEGLYHHAWRGEAAWIELFVDKIFAGSPRWAFKLRVVREGFLALTLFHELGHHLHSTQSPEHRDKEQFAESCECSWLRGRLRRSRRGRCLHRLRPRPG